MERKWGLIERCNRWGRWGEIQNPRYVFPSLSAEDERLENFFALKFVFRSPRDSRWFFEALFVSWSAIMHAYRHHIHFNSLESSDFIDKSQFSSFARFFSALFCTIYRRIRASWSCTLVCPTRNWLLKLFSTSWTRFEIEKSCFDQNFNCWRTSCKNISLLMSSGGIAQGESATCTLFNDRPMI